MAKVKVVNTNLDQNLNGTNFNNTASETIFQFGSFAVTSNFDGRIPIDYTNTLSSFVRPVTLDTLGLNTVQSTVLLQYQTNAVLNLDKSNLNTFVKFGSTYEFFRVSIQEIILAYPGSLFANSNLYSTLDSVYDIDYDGITNTTVFKVPSPVLVNKFGLIFNQGNVSEPNNVALKNLNLSYDKYAVWSKYNPDSYYPVVAFTGDTPTAPSPHITLKVIGNPFPFLSGATYGDFDFHIRPNTVVFEEFRAILSSYEQYILAQRDGMNGFTFNVSDPTLLDDGNVTYSTTSMLWTTTDDYNIDIDNASYQRFLTALLTIGNKYDLVKTDLIARFLTPSSIKTYDLTEEGKMTKLLRVYGWEFDQLKKFIDSLANINTVTYDKINNIPDQLISNLARTFGWDYFNLVNEAELVDSLLSVTTAERNLNTDLLPAEVNIELWRRILINTNYFWKSKGTRHAIKAMFLLIGIPEPFINITEYVYTVDGKINPNTVPFGVSDFPNSSLPYDNSGYPQAPLESPTFYFQISGDTDGGQAYMNNFRKAGFRLTPIVDNKKSWIQTGATTRIHYDTPQYDQLDSKLVLNTKEVDVSLDTARGIEYDVYSYIQKDFAANSSGFTLPYSYVNISLAYSGTQNVFPMPQETQGDFEVRYNGILLNAPKTGTTTGITYQADYTINYNTNTFTITGGTAINSGNRRDVVEVTYIFSGGTHPVSGITVKYIVTRVKAQFPGTFVDIPSYPRGDIQVTINGIALTKGTPQFTADYVLDPANSVSGTNRIIIQNVDVIAYLAVNPDVQIAYVEVAGSNDINARSEITRVDSLSGGKIYFDVSANKNVYTLNYKANNASDLKILIDGIALEPQTDYQMNMQNLYQVFLPKGIQFGSIISVYYLVGGNAAFAPIVTNSFGVGDISNLSFLEFIELIQRRLINVRTRKTISDFKGGWYPALLNVYIQYLKRGLLPENDPLHSNGYTFENLYPFLSKYNAFFERFVNELLPATIILKQNGLLVRNTVFTKQKYMYRRGVNLSGTTAGTDMRGLPFLQYLGDDGSQFLINQGVVPPPPPVVFDVDTKVGVPGIGSITNFGGENIINYNLLSSYGVQYKILPGDMWCNVTELGAPVTNSYTMSVSGLQEATQYMYQAFVIANSCVATGDILFTTTLATPLTPEIHTKVGVAGVTTIDTGGINIVCGSSTDWYGMQYRVVGSTLTDIAVTPSTLSMPAAGTTCCVCVAGEPANTYTTACNVPWITTVPAVIGSPSLSGSISEITTSTNIGHIPRTGLVCYTPTVGTTKCVTVCQAPTIVPYKVVSMLCCTGGISTPLECLSIGAMQAQPPEAPSECYSAMLCWQFSKPITSLAPHFLCVEFCKNGCVIGVCQYGSKSAVCCGGMWGPFTALSSDVFEGRAYAEAQTSSGNPSIASIKITSISSISGNFCKGVQDTIYAQTSSSVTTTTLPFLPE